MGRFAGRVGVCALLGMWLGACGGGGGGGVPCDPAQPPKVSGSWLLSAPDVSSDCPDDVTNALVAALLDGSTTGNSCRYQVNQSGPQVTVANRCGGSATFRGCADDDGCVDATWQFSTGANACKTAAAVEFSADLSTAFSDADISADFTFPPACGVSDCSIDIGVAFTAQP